ncbi:MAG: hypothetical protein WD098_02625 [Balneolales bacterium]
MNIVSQLSCYSRIMDSSVDPRVDFDGYVTAIGLKELNSDRSLMTCMKPHHHHSRGG